MMRLIVYTIVIISAWACTVASGAGNDEIHRKIDSLLQNGEFETAATYIVRKLPGSNDESFLSFKMSQVEVNRGNLQSAFVYFSRAIALLPAEPTTETLLKQNIEKTLDVVALLRRYECYPIALSILNALHDQSPNYSSILYALAELSLTKSEFCDFFEYYYKAYQINPTNFRSLTGKAAIHSVTETKPPTPGSFPWLAAAVEFYDNPMIWKYVMAELLKYNIFDNEVKLNTFAQTVPPKIRNIFYYYYYQLTSQHEKASEAINELKLFLNSGDFRFDICRRNLLLDTERLSEAIDGLMLSSLSSGEEILYYNFWIAYWEKSEWTQNTLSSYEGFLNSLTETTSAMLTKAQRLTNENNLISHWVGNSIKKRSPHKAITLLEAHVKKLNLTNLAFLASLYLMSSEHSKAIGIMERQFANCPLDQQQEIVIRILDYSALKGNWNTIRKYVTDKKVKDSISIVKEYEEILSPLAKSASVDRQILSIPGCFFLGDTDWKHWEGLGPCVANVVFSIENFWQKKVHYSDVATGIIEVQGDRNKHPLDILQEYLQNNDFSVAYLVPTKTAIISLLSNNVPVVLIDTIFMEGINFGHAGIIYAYDNQLEKFFIRDTSKTGERRVGYRNIFESTVLIGIVPTLSVGGLMSNELKDLTLPSFWDVLSPEKITLLSNADPSLEWWAYRHNADILSKQKDASCIEFYEKCIDIKEPSDTTLYEKLSIACLSSGQEIKADKYIKMGLRKEPNNLLLLRYQIQMRRDAALESEKLDFTLTQELLTLTCRMEVINPDYPWTYFLRGDLYARGMRRQQPTITAFLCFLEKYQNMNETWKREHAPYLKHAQRAINICRDSLASRQE